MHSLLSRTLLFTLTLVAFGCVGAPATVAQNPRFNTSLGPANNNWSNAFNWVGQEIADTNMEIAEIAFGDPVVDADFTIQQLRTIFSTSGASVSGPGTLTIDVNSGSTALAILNGSGPPQGGSVLALDGSVVINNSGGARTVARIQNSDQNVIRFDANSVLTLQTGLEIQQGIGGAIEFNGQLAGTENVFIGSTNSSFGADADNAGYEGDLVFFSSASTVSNIVGGTLIETGQKIQVNGNNSSIEINGADTFFGNVVVDGSNVFTFDVDADQTDMGFLEVANGGITIDIDAAVSEAAFANSSEALWGTGSVSIIGFEEDTVRFGTDASGLTPSQLAAIDGGIYSLTSQGYLTTDATTSPAGDFNDDGQVDAADYTVWRDQLNSTDALPNDDGLGTPISIAHYNLWSTNFGQSSAAASAAPEPGAILLALGAIGAVCRGRRRDLCVARPTHAR